MNRGGSARSVETVILAALVDIPRLILFPKAVMTSRNFWLRSALALSLGFYSWIVIVYVSSVAPA